MCGIAGYLGLPQTGHALDDQALLSGLRHRGPDAHGQIALRTRHGLTGSLLATRLAILDLSPLGHQPMQSQNGRLALVFNGEIYNHAALRTELQQAGAAFRSGSDTEVVLVGYEHWGDRLWPRLRGMFALSLWDENTEELRLVRDPLGQKPLYYFTDAADGRLQRLGFASEIRPLLSAGTVPPRIDPGALVGYLTWGSVPEPRTIVAGIRALPPGHLLRLHVRRDRLQITPPTAYDAPPTDGLPPPSSQAEAVQVLREGLSDTLRCHLQADVPVGLLLSGGIDSTSLAAWARAVAPDQPLWAFTLAAETPAMAAELACATATAQALRLRHEVIRVSAATAVAALPDWLAAQDQPSLDGFNTYLICAGVRAAGCKVVLGGAGGDELFFGYGLHRRFATAWAAYKGLPAWLRLRLPKEDLAAWLYRSQRRLFPPAIQRLLLQNEIRNNVQNEAEPALPYPPPASFDLQAATWASSFAEGLAQVQAFERSFYLRNTLLRDGDVLSMAHSIELRLPLCDPWLWQLVSGLAPWSHAENKGLLVAAAPPGDSRVAAAAAHRKIGFDLPLDDWLRGPLARAVETLFFDEAQVVAAGLQPGTLRRLWQAHRLAAAAPREVRRRLAGRIWALYVWLAYVKRQALSPDGGL
jgi:asparagine synthase (glutamine-hydrolysing)